MNKEKWARSKKGGFALVLVLCVVILLLIIGVGVLSFGMHSRTAAVRTSSEISARSAADAGVTQALYTLNQMLEVGYWKDSSLPYAVNVPLPNSDSSFSYKTTKLNAKEADEDDLYIIECIGKSGLTQKSVSCTLELQGLFEYAIFTLGDILLRNGTTVTAYNTKDGDSPLQVGTNSIKPGAIDTKLGVTIDGDIVVGPDGDPDVVIDSTRLANITGSTYPSLVKNKTPKINIPKSLLAAPSSGEIKHSTTLSNSGKYDGIDLTGSTDSDLIKIDSNIKLYITGDIRLGNSDELQIVGTDTHPDASLVIYLGGNLIIDNGGSINNLTKDSKKLKIYGLETCDAFDFKNSGTFYGAVYAPTADIHLYNGVQMYGSVVGKSFIQDVDADFHYDMSLRETDATEIGVHLVVKRWSDN